MEMIEIEAEIVHETKLAVLVNDGDKDIWLPKNYIQYEGRIGQTVEIKIPDWIANDKGLL